MVSWLSPAYVSAVVPVARLATVLMSLICLDFVLKRETQLNTFNCDLYSVKVQFSGRGGDPIERTEVT